MTGFFIQLALGMVAIGLAIPLLVAAFLCKGLPRLGVDDFDFNRSFKVASSASAASFCLLIVVTMLLPTSATASSSGGVSVGMIVNAVTLVAGQLILLPLLVRRFSKQILLLEAGSVLLANFIVLLALYQLRDFVPR